MDESIVTDGGDSYDCAWGDYDNDGNLDLFVVNIFNQANFLYRNITPQRAMWIWDQPTGLVNNIIDNVSTFRSELFEFCRQPHGDSDKSISTLFFDAGNAISNNMFNLREFITTVHDSGLFIEYLSGDENWATTIQDSGFSRLNKIIQFNNGGNLSERFDRIQFDVEPYKLSEWKTDSINVYNSYISFLDSCQSIVDHSGLSLKFGVAIPRWYDVNLGIDKLHDLLDIVDYVAIMDYSDKSVSIINDAQNEIDYADTIGKKVWIGVETGNVYPESDWITFYNEDVPMMETELEEVDNHFKGHFSYMGIAIHHYSSYKTLSTDVDEIDENKSSASISYRINQNYPNPFNPSTTIHFSLPNPCFVTLRVYNLLGKEIETLVNGYRQEGEYRIGWTAENLSSGIYLIRLEAEDYVATRKMILKK